MLKEGEIIEIIDGPIHRDTLKNYSDASGDKNPIHLSDEIASKYKLNGVIAHGLLSFGYGARIVDELALKHDGKLIKIGCEMRGMVRPGDWIISTFTVDKISGNIAEISFIQDSKMPLTLEKNGEIIKKFEGEERGWVKEKELGGVQTEETPEGTLKYRRWLVNKGWAKIQF